MTEGQIHNCIRRALQINSDSSYEEAVTTQFNASGLQVEFTTLGTDLWVVVFLPDGNTLDNNFGQLLLPCADEASEEALQRVVLDLRDKLQARWLSEVLA